MYISLKTMILLLIAVFAIVLFFSCELYKYLKN